MQANDKLGAGPVSANYKTSDYMESNDEEPEKIFRMSLVMFAFD